MVNELWNCKQVVDHLGITINNLRQLQYRKTIAWVKKEGKEVFYLADEVRAYKNQRENRNNRIVTKIATPSVRSLFSKKKNLRRK